MNILKRWFGRAETAAQPALKAATATRAPLNISHEARGQARVGGRRAAAIKHPFKPAEHPKSVVPASVPTMAMDDAITSTQGWAAGLVGGTGDEEGIYFLGYPYLSELAQRPEYRMIAETFAREMTRKWIRITAKGDEDKTDRIATIAATLERFQVRDVFRRATEQDGFFGRAHVYPDLGTGDDAEELKTPIGNGRDAASRAKIGKGALKGFRVVEAVWCYPAGYNTTDPLSDAWYKPTSWYVQGKQIHASRLLTFVGREVPDLLKPTYSFGGLSMSQMAKPYVDNWLTTRESVSDLIASFSVSGVKTNMQDALAGGAGDQLFARVDMFTNMRDNRGTMVLHKGSGDSDPAEEFFNVSTPLGTLDVLQAQSQEQVASVAGIPLVIFLGVTPAGLNASSDGEIRAFYDRVHAKQEDDYRPPLTKVIDIIQLSEFGDIDTDISFEFIHLWSLNDKERAEVRKVDADTDQVLIDSGVILPDEARKRIAGDPETVYQGLDLTIEIAPEPAEVLGEPPVPDDADVGDREAA